MGNVVTSVCSILLMGFVLKVDNESVMQTICPLEALLDRLVPSAADAPAEQPGPLGPRCADAMLVLKCSLLQLFYSIRAAVLGPLCMLGSAYIFAEADTALDNVMNSVAVGFILELDDILYEQLIDQPVRDEFEANMAALPHQSSPQVVPGGRLVVSCCTCLVYFIDFTLAILAYVCVTGRWGDCDDNVTKYVAIQTNVCLRIGIFAGGEMLLAFLARRDATAKRGTAAVVTLLMLVLLYGCMIVGFLALVLPSHAAHSTRPCLYVHLMYSYVCLHHKCIQAWTASYTILGRFMGMRTDVLGEPNVMACLNKQAAPADKMHWSALQCSYIQNVYDENDCIHLHETTIGTMYPNAQKIGTSRSLLET